MIKKLFSSNDDGDDTPGVESKIDPDRYFLIIFLKGSPTIYRTWIWKSDLEEFKKRLYGAEDTISLRKKFFQFGRHDEIDLTEVAGYQTRPYIITESDPES